MVAVEIQRGAVVGDWRCDSDDDVRSAGRSLRSAVRDWTGRGRWGDEGKGLRRLNQSEQSLEVGECRGSSRLVRIKLEVN